MSRNLFASITAGTMALFLVTACAEDSKDAAAATGPGVVTEAPGNSGDTSGSIMDQPVDFSTPENVEKSLQKIREEEGDGAYKNLENAMKYILFYDLSVSGNKEKLHEKLDDQTPNQIIAEMKR